MKTKRKPDVRPYYPVVFKKLCGDCGQYFVREPGWKHWFWVKDVGWVNTYLCGECAPSFEEAFIWWHGRIDYEYWLEYNRDTISKEKFRKTILQYMTSTMKQD